jgi:hypothetical protein
MKYEKIVIETDGTMSGTKLFIDDEKIEFIQRIEFSSDINFMFTNLNVQVAKIVNGNVKKKKIKVRDLKTEKFIDKVEIESVSLNLEMKRLK